jgi:hypothetical protein
VQGVDLWKLQALDFIGDANLKLPTRKLHHDHQATVLPQNKHPLVRCAYLSPDTAANMASPRNPGSSAGQSSAALLLAKQFKQIQTDKDIPGISCGLVGNNVFEWEVMLMLSEDQDSLYGGE